MEGVYFCVETASTERYARNWFGEYLQPISRTQQPISKHVRNLFHFASRLIILISIKMLNSHRAKLYGMTRSRWHSHLVRVCVCALSGRIRKLCVIAGKGLCFCSFSSSQCWSSDKEKNWAENFTSDLKCMKTYAQSIQKFGYKHEIILGDSRYECFIEPMQLWMNGK